MRVVEAFHLFMVLILISICCFLKDDESIDGIIESSLAPKLVRAGDMSDITHI